MPIKFRCPHCRQFLGISRGKAGALTDCPTCGRTIRIPDLDGKVKPLPKPELNLGDSELAGALDALARLDSVRAAPATSGGDRHESSPRAIAVKAAEIRELEPAPVAQPVAIEPVARAEPAVSPKNGPALESAGARSSADALDELIRLDPAATVAATSRSRSGSKSRLVAIVVGGGLLFGMGVLTGRLTAPDPAVNPATTGDRSGGAPADPAEALPAGTIPAEPAVEAIPALSGRLTYASQGGVQPDAGARVVVLPAEREGTAKLPVVGFRAGAAPADQTLARTSIRALGGDYTTADDQGRYTVRLATAGEYRVLFLSRFQPRDEAGFLEPSLQEALANYFDRPAALIGPVAYEFVEFTFRGEDAVPRDHVFPDE